MAPHQPSAPRLLATGLFAAALLAGLASAAAQPAPEPTEPFMAEPAAREPVVRVDAFTTGGGARIEITWPDPTGVAETQTEPRSLWLRFDRPLGDAAVAGLPDRLPAWLSGVRYGYDSLLLETRRPARFSVSAGATVAITLADLPPAEGAASAAPPPGDRRIEHLRALALADSGDLGGAQTLLERLAATAPDDPAVATDLARVTEDAGDWRAALDGYRHAAAIGSEPAAQAAARLLRARGPMASLGTVVRDVDGADRQTVTTAEGRVLWGDRGLAGVRLEDRHLSIGSVRRAGGTVESVDRHLASAEAWVGHNGHDGSETQLGLLVNPEGTGFRLSHLRGAWPDETAFDAIYHQAYFGYVEGVADDTVRDRLAVRRGGRLGEKVTGALGASANRYWIADRRVANGVGLTGTLQFAQSDAVTFGYTLDAEYLGDVATRPAAGGGSFRPLPVTDREVHALGITLSGSNGDRLRYGAGAGYAYDRLNASGVFANGRVTCQLNENVDLALHAGRSANVDRGTSSTVWEYGFALVWRPAPSRVEMRQ